MSFQGDFMITNDTIESTSSFYFWPSPHRLKYKIMNHDDLLSYAEFNIVNTEVSFIYSLQTVPPI